MHEFAGQDQSSFLTDGGLYWVVQEKMQEITEWTGLQYPFQEYVSP